MYTHVDVCVRIFIEYLAITLDHIKNGVYIGSWKFSIVKVLHFKTQAVPVGKNTTLESPASLLHFLRRVK